MNGQIDLKTIVLFVLGGVATYIAYRNPIMGAAIVVGIAVVAYLSTVIK